jgi:hypothetical protein
MKQNQIEEGRLSRQSQGLGTVTEEMVMGRARELAEINGRPADNVLDSDIDQARRELTGQEGLAPEPTKAEELSEEQRWEAVPGSVGKKAPTVPAPDEQTYAEKLVEEGVSDAEQDQMIKATRESLKRESLPE